MSREDVFNIKHKAVKYLDSLEKNNFSKYESDNKIIKRYIVAKFQGNYRSLVYDVNCPEKKVYKNLIVLRKILEIINKPIESFL